MTKTVWYQGSMVYDVNLSRIEDKADCSMRCKQNVNLVRAYSGL